MTHAICVCVIVSDPRSEVGSRPVENTVAQRCSLCCAHHLMAPLRPLSCEQAHPFHTLPNVLLSPRVVRCLGVEAPPSPAKSPSKSPVKAAQQAVAPSTEPEVSLVPAAAASELAAAETPSPPPTRRSSIFSQASEDALTGRQKALYKDLSDLKAEAREYAEVAWQRASRASRASHARADSWLNQESSESVLG